MNKDDVKILLVDDARMALALNRRVLAELGFTNVHEAGGGREGLTKIDEALRAGAPFTLVLCDWMMDDVDGIRVLEECRRAEATRTLPIIMLTAEAEGKSMVRAMKAGANDYLIKPVTLASLGPKIDRVLSRIAGKIA